MENLFDKKVRTKSEMLQKSCHEFTELFLESNPEMTYQDITNVWIFKKLAEIQVQVAELQKVR